MSNTCPPTPGSTHAQARVPTDAGGSLEFRVVPAAAVLTTNTYANALGAIHDTTQIFFADPGPAGVSQLQKNLMTISRAIPYGGKQLYPGLIKTIVNYVKLADIWRLNRRWIAS